MDVKTMAMGRKEELLLFRIYNLKQNWLSKYFSFEELETENTTRTTT